MSAATADVLVWLGEAGIDAAWDPARLTVVVTPFAGATRYHIFTVRIIDGTTVATRFLFRGWRSYTRRLTLRRELTPQDVMGRLAAVAGGNSRMTEANREGWAWYQVRMDRWLADRPVGGEA